MEGYCLVFRDCRDGGLFFLEIGVGGGGIVSTIHACIILYICFQCPGDAVSAIHACIILYVFRVLEMLF